MAKTKHRDVYINKEDEIFVEVSLGTDKVTGNRIKKKTRTAENGKKFETLEEAAIEASRIRNEYLQNQGYSEYSITYLQYMNTVYIPFYETEVSQNTL